MKGLRGRHAVLTMKICFQQTNSASVLLHIKGNKWKSFGSIGEEKKKKENTKADALGETCRPNPQSL